MPAESACAGVRINTRVRTNAGVPINRPRGRPPLNPKAAPRRHFASFFKVRLGKLVLHQPFATLFPAQLVANDIHLMPLELPHIEPLTTLPLHHRDPFDRLVVSTALVEGLTLVSADAALDAYCAPRLW